jgi:hypothetical protein
MLKKFIASPVTTAGAVVGTVVGSVVGATVVVGVVSAGLLPPQAVRENARTRVSARQMPRVIRFFICIISPIKNFCVLHRTGQLYLMKSPIARVFEKINTLFKISGRIAIRHPAKAD